MIFITILAACLSLIYSYQIYKNPLNIDLNGNLLPSMLFSFSDKLSIHLDSIYGREFYWYNYQNIEDFPFHFYSDFSKCTFCNFNSTENTTRDDSKDLVIGVSVSQYANVYPFIQSLRSTGCKAQVLLIVDNTLLNFTKIVTPTFFEDCGVNLVSIGDTTNKIKRLVYYYYIKHFSTAFFLNSHRGFNRVFVTDVSDVVFQQNPFQLQISEPFFIVPTEGKYGYHVANLGNPADIKAWRIIVSVDKNQTYNKTFYEYTCGTAKRYFNAGIYLSTVEYAKNISIEIIKYINLVNENQKSRFISLNYRLEEQNLYTYLLQEIVFPNETNLYFDFQTNYELFSIYPHHLARSVQFPYVKYQNHLLRVVHEIYASKSICESVQKICPPVFDNSPYEKMNNKQKYYRC